MGLSDYIDATIGTGLGNVIGWSATNTSRAFDDTLEVYGVVAEADAADLTKLHSIARYQAWKQAKSLVVGWYAFSADGASYSRNQVYDHIKSEYETALTDVLVYMPSYNLEVGVYDDAIYDPYNSLPYGQGYRDV